jgi:hypothetical protein
MAVTTAVQLTTTVVSLWHTHGTAMMSSLIKCEWYGNENKNKHSGYNTHTKVDTDAPSYWFQIRKNQQAFSAPD